MWDCHVHAVGIGDSDSGIWVTPKMTSWWHPVSSIQYRFYLNASCVEDDRGIDNHYVSQLLALYDNFPVGAKAMLLAFDYHHDQDGMRDLARSTFFVPNEYVARVAQQSPDRFEWIASVHPYRTDCEAALAWVKENGARGVKWLPPAMGMDPSSPRCDRFYNAMARLNMPLLSHAGDEHAVDGDDYQRLGNPLLLRRALDHGVRVIVAHCATQGSNVDLDEGPNGPLLANFQLFARLMEESRYEGLVFGEISAVTQINRINEGLSRIIERSEWHSRLINGSDYPLPGVMPLFSMDALISADLLDEEAARYCRELRAKSPLLADFVIKRLLSSHKKRFAREVFMTRDFFSPMS